MHPDNEHYLARYDLTELNILTVAFFLLVATGHTTLEPVQARRRVCAHAASADAPALAGLIFPCGGPSAWDAGAVSNPVIRVFPGDSESRWFMWYTGRDAESAVTDAAMPAASKIGAYTSTLAALETAHALWGKCSRGRPPYPEDTRIGAGVAVSSDGIHWSRSSEPVTGDRSAGDVGACLGPNDEEWWTLDTHSVAVSDVQMFSSGTVNGGTGVYWMFYTGADYQSVRVPEGIPGLEAGAEVEGLCGRPGLAMSQARTHDLLSLSALLAFAHPLEDRRQPRLRRAMLKAHKARAGWPQLGAHRSGSSYTRAV